MKIPALPPTHFPTFPRCRRAGEGKWAGVILFCVALNLALAGCSSLLKTTQTTSSTAKVTAEAAMRSWGRYVEQFHPSVAQELAVQKAFDTYKAAQLTMLDAAIAYSTSIASTNAAAQGTAQLKLDAAVAGISAALADLVKLLASYGVNLQPGG